MIFLFFLVAGTNRYVSTGIVNALNAKGESWKYKALIFSNKYWKNNRWEEFHQKYNYDTEKDAIKEAIDYLEDLQKKDEDDEVAAVEELS